MHKGRALALVGFAACAAIVVSATIAGAAIQNVKRYTVPLPGSGYETKRLLSVGDTVPVTGNSVEAVPDGRDSRRHRSASEPATGRGRSS